MFANLIIICIYFINLFAINITLSKKKKKELYNFNKFDREIHLFSKQNKNIFTENNNRGDL